MPETINKPIIVKGKHNEALVFARVLETVCENKIKQYLDHPAFSDTMVRIMPDVHISQSTVVGWTATYNSLVIPSVIGFDIGCGVCACNLGRGKLAFDKLDKYIRHNIPSGKDVRSSLHDGLDEISNFISKDGSNAASQLFDAGNFKNEIHRISEKLGQGPGHSPGHDPERILASLGTLGGGNHFIEIDVDENSNRWLLIHSGSRIFGAWAAEYHETIALRETEAESNIKYLSGACAEEYLTDVQIIQYYARLNRALMALDIAKRFFNIDMRDTEYYDCVHNCIDAANSIVRKGAISAKIGEPVIIPFSMAEGAVIGKGKGNAAWNCSAPHGSGRKKARTDAKSLSLDEYRKEMRGVWSSVIGKDTLEESPMAYKNPREVLDYIGETVEVEQRLRPVYNFKSS